MATKESISVTDQLALRRTLASCAVIAAELGIEPPTLPMNNRDRAYLAAKQREVLSLWLEDVAATLAAPKKKAKASV